MSQSRTVTGRSAALRRLADHLTETTDIQRLTTAAGVVEAEESRRPLARFLSRFISRPEAAGDDKDQAANRAA